MIHALGRLGVHLIRDTGKHAHYGYPGKHGLSAAIPRHARIKRNLLRDILGELGVTEEAFMERY
ncbi:MAG: type II toxin-antitoxin system HicA family toxin [Armatimonadetes bacterium]|nr:type II toxin-antitoxin system HicA family toxin [Armatimonadota bacterium]